MSTSNDHWQKKHETEYKVSDWIDKPSLFAETAVGYFPATGAVLELGAGQGQDSRFFAEHGYDVTSTDLEDAALALNLSKVSPDLRKKLTVQRLDISKTLPFEAASFDVVYAHLSLHYFDKTTTQKIYTEIYRVLKPGGLFAFFVNSTNDPQYGTGRQIEPDFFQIDQISKRFFSTDTAQEYTHQFKTILLDNNGETYKDRAKDVHNLIRFIGTKV